ncbi:MAG TPA: DUF5668 domain-containing protein [Ferruginibacter sp.]|nr:DUF5668 domain-containing protein [Ferruginibacter sp.]HMP20411.1 DUF5668 domain-containing protein [Ferruginibacter sp.]
MEKSFNPRHRQNGRIVAGLILVGVGALLLLRNTGYALFPSWLFSWPMILILIGIYSGVKHNFRNSTWIILLVIGGFFLVERVAPEMHIRPYIWPAAIIVAGAVLLLRPKGSGWCSDKDDLFDSKKNYNKKDKDMNSTTWESTGSTAFSDMNDFLKINSVFSGVERNVLSKNLQGGKVTAVFGGVDLDLSQADIQGEVVLKLEVIFGGVKIVVPPHWTVYNNIDGVFHGVEDKRRGAAATGFAPDKKLILTGSAIFGGVDIKSY